MVRRLIVAVLAFSSVCLAQPHPRLVAIGDIHGDLDALTGLLDSQHLIDSQGHWIGGDARLVLMGDLNDGGRDTRLIYDYVMSLEAEARAAGGDVDTLLGNHELRSWFGQVRPIKDGGYTSPAELEDFAQFGPQDIKDLARRASLGMTELFKPGQPLGDWFIRRPVIVKIDRTIFVHAGLEKWMIGKTPDQINAMVHKQMAAFNDPNATPAPKSEKWVVGGGPAGSIAPTETRRMAFATMDSETAAEWLKDHEGATGMSTEDLLAILKDQDADRVVIGHTELQRVTSAHGGRVWNIDASNSRWAKGSAADNWSSIEIANGEVKVTTTPRLPRETPLMKAVSKRMLAARAAQAAEGDECGAFFQQCKAGAAAAIRCITGAFRRAK